MASIQSDYEAGGDLDHLGAPVIQMNGDGVYQSSKRLRSGKVAGWLCE
jgi:hypothetical protein